MKTIILGLIFSSLAIAQFMPPSSLVRRVAQFESKLRLEKGDYDFSTELIITSLTNTFPYIIPRSPADDLYKINEFGEYQVKDYYLKDFYIRQKEFSTDIDLYSESFNGEDFVSAKRNYYSSLVFDYETLKHQHEENRLKVWGGLNHPPVHSLERPLTSYDSELANMNRPSSSEFYSLDFQERIDSISQSTLTYNNKIEVLEDVNSYWKKLELIDNAKRFVFISTLTFVCDKSGNYFANELINKAVNGLKVFMIIDKQVTRFANILNFNCLKDLEEHENIWLIRADDFFSHKGQAIYHSKMIIADSSIAIVGGMNFIDADHISHGTDFNNRDIDVLVHGPVVQDISLAFINAWQYFRGKHKKLIKKTPSLNLIKNKVLDIKIKDFENNLRGTKKYSRDLQGACRFVTQSPTQSPSRVAETTLEYLKQVKRYLGIINPMHYDQPKDNEKFEWFNKIFAEIDRLKNDGIRIDYISTQADMAANELVPIIRERLKGYLKDNKIGFANIAKWEIDIFNEYHAKDMGHYPNLINNYSTYTNVEVWNHISFIHTKLLLMDNIVTSIGSMNIHHNATDRAWEVSLICQDEKFSEDVRRILIKDKANSIPLIYKEIIGF